MTLLLRVKVTVFNETKFPSLKLKLRYNRALLSIVINLSRPSQTKLNMYNMTATCFETVAVQF